jgi:hypothetical protein
VRLPPISVALLKGRQRVSRNRVGYSGDDGEADRRRPIPGRPAGFPEGQRWFRDENSAGANASYLRSYQREVNEPATYPLPRVTGQQSWVFPSPPSHAGTGPFPRVADPRFAAPPPAPGTGGTGELPGYEFEGWFGRSGRHRSGMVRTPREVGTVGEIRTARESGGPTGRARPGGRRPTAADRRAQSRSSVVEGGRQSNRSAASPWADAFPPWPDGGRTARGFGFGGPAVVGGGWNELAGAPGYRHPGPATVLPTARTGLPGTGRPSASATAAGSARPHHTADGWLRSFLTRSRQHDDRGDVRRFCLCGWLLVVAVVTLIALGVAIGIVVSANSRQPAGAAARSVVFSPAVLAARDSTP